MKHILNNLSEEEKNAIREQHTGGMKVMTENFSKLLNSKLGDAKPLVNEQALPGLSSGNSQNSVKMVFDSCKNIPVKIDNNSNAIADNIYKAIQGIGTDENAIMKAFSMTPTLNVFCSVNHSYGKTYGNSLFSDLDGDIDQESVWAGISRILRNLKQVTVTKPTTNTKNKIGMKVMTENFSKLLNSKLGDSKPLVAEQVKSSGPSEENITLFTNAFNVNRFKFDPKSSDARMAFVHQGKPLTYVGPFGATIFLDKNGKRINAQSRNGGIVSFNVGHKDFSKVMDWLEINSKP